MKKVIVFLTGLIMLLFLILNHPSVSRNIRRLHLFNSATLLKSSSFDDFTIDIFQDNNHQVKVEIYSSHKWFTNDNTVHKIPVTLKPNDISIFWKKFDLESEEHGSRSVIAVLVESVVEGEEMQFYRGSFSNSDADSFEDVFNWLAPDVKDNPSQVD